MEKCEHYHEDIVLYAKMPCRYKTLYRCYATKDCEGCTCCGDKSKCDFYENVRKEASKMNTYEMMKLACEDGKTYRCSHLLFNINKGFHVSNGIPWEGKAFKTLNDLFKLQEWQLAENVMTKSEAEAKFNIKIVG